MLLDLEYLRHPEEEIVAESVVDDLVDVARRKDDAHVVKADVDEKVVMALAKGWKMSREDRTPPSNQKDREYTQSFRDRSQLRDEDAAVGVPVARHLARLGDEVAARGDAGEGWDRGLGAGGPLMLLLLLLRMERAVVALQQMNELNS